MSYKKMCVDDIEEKFIFGIKFFTYILNTDAAFCMNNFLSLRMTIFYDWVFYSKRFCY